MPVHIRSLLRDQNFDTALFASVRLHNDQQVFDFKLIHADGRNQQGSISYPSLPADAHSISQQLLYLLRPGQQREIQVPADDPIAAQALAQGMQALQEAGPIKAQKYFQASLTIQDNSPWTRLKQRTHTVPPNAAAVRIGASINLRRLLSSAATPG